MPHETHDDSEPVKGHAEPDWTARQEEAVLLAALNLVEAESRWDEALVRRAGEKAGLSPAALDLVLPNGARDLAALLSRRHDRKALTRLEAEGASALKVRDKIRRGVAARVEAAFEDEAAVRAATRFLSHPSHAGLAGRLVWESADALWRFAGDQAADFNHYSKRAILSTVLATTLARRLSHGAEAAERHLDFRIDGVMRFEKLKARVQIDPVRMAERAVEHLARLRYPAR